MMWKALLHTGEKQEADEDTLAGMLREPFTSQNEQSAKCP